MNPFELCEHRDYDCVSSAIRCRADRGDSQVFEIQSGNVIVRALAHNEEDARSAAEDYARSELDGNP